MGLPHRNSFADGILALQLQVFDRVHGGFHRFAPSSENAERTRCGLGNHHDS